ncbi:alpha/beta hydrolase [Neobacillus cucumis]|uniref:alpha/beta hydrolase n=1 Tax=Neobacillus cucumis TaxID=1740721 RepID=UPI00204037B1|nr:alpha/beta hydrolase [Neobacillus cucumis]MCM3726955.1 alpha/beta hydrolase [Neobacillus cucumis]
MPSFQSYFFEKAIKLSVKRAVKKGVRPKGIVEQREMLDTAASKIGRLPKNCQVVPLEIEGLYAEWLTTGIPLPDKVILYLHGGGYALCSANTHRPLSARIGKQAGLKVLFPEYRLAPEHPFPAAIEDAVNVYQWLLKQGYTGKDIIFAGDSAGGGLCLATALVLRDQNDPLPAGIVCLSPWVDLTSSGESYQKNEEVDPYLSLRAVKEAAQMYAGKESLDHPLISPVFADLTGLPPLMIQSGTHEILQSDAISLSIKAKAAGVKVSFKAWDGMWHVWQISGDHLPEARRATKEIGQFIKRIIQT